MSNKPNLAFYYSCGEIFQKYNQEFLIVCTLCKRNFSNYDIFTEHSVKCSFCKDKLVKPPQKQLSDIAKKIDGPGKKTILKINLNDALKTSKAPTVFNSSIENVPQIQASKDKKFNISRDSLAKTEKKSVDPKKQDQATKKPKKSKTVSVKGSVTTRKMSNGNTHGTARQSSIKKAIKIYNTMPKIKNLTSRKRVIKKKIIWDPDGPESQIPVTKIICEKLIRSLNIKGRTQRKSIFTVPTSSNSSPIKALQSTRKHKKHAIADGSKSRPPHTKRIIKKKIIWDPDAPDVQVFK